jgi:hypothetical protein
MKTMLNSMKKIHLIGLCKASRITALSLTVVLTIVMAITLPLSTHAKIYKWVDENGKVHYGAEKPADTKAERIKVNIQPATSTDKSDADESNTDGKDGEKSEKKPERLEGDAIIPKKEKAMLCSKAKARVKSIQNSGRLRAYDEKGQSRILSDKERNKRLSSAKKDVKEYCN